MDPKWMHATRLCLSGVAIVCWIVMFLAGTDVWHHVGRPDFWKLAGPPYTDLRAFGYAFYLLFVILALHVMLTVAGIVMAKRERLGRAL